MAESEAPYRLTIVLRAFAVELSGVNMAPQFINPATLKFNDVVDEGWTYSDVEVGMTESSVSYTNGLQIEAFEQTLRFQHVHTGGEFLSAEIARRYVEAFGDDSWFAVRLEFGGTMELAGESDSADIPLQPNLLDRMTHHDVVPAFRAGALYPYPEHALQIELQQPADSINGWFECAAQVNRLLVPDEAEEDNGRLQAILSGWESDWADSALALTRLASATLQPGGN